MKYCDLHNHSTYSDGSDTPKELCILAKEKGIDALALTDHNTVDGIFEFEKCAKEAGLEYVLATELTTEYNGTELHLICMFINENNAHRVADFCTYFRTRKSKINQQMAEALSKDVCEISYDDMVERFGKNINRSHFAKILIEKGIVKSTDEAFDTVLKEGNGYYFVTKRPDVLETIKQVNSWGCVSVLAHPLLNFTKEQLEEFIPHAKEAGLIGMEAYYSKYTPDQVEYLLDLCEKYQIIPSGGSDYHGEIKKSVGMGSANAPYSCYENLKNALAK
jgi:predicted metal-dependent phosphoesterase TrpH